MVRLRSSVLHPISQVMKSKKCLRMSILSPVSEKDIARILKKMTCGRSSQFDIRHSIDVMHIKKNVCESLLKILLNTDRESRDHGHARAGLKKMEIRLELWLNDLVKGTELPTSCTTLSKHENNEFCGFLKNVKVPSCYSTNASRLISLQDLKVDANVKSHDYHVLLTQMIIIAIQSILLVNDWEARMNFCFFFNAIGQKLLSEEALESLEKGTMKLYAF
jgi:hypothetical protein